MTQRIENTAFGGNVEMMSEKIKGFVKMIDKTSCIFIDDMTATSKEVKSELDRCGFRYFGTNY